MATKKHNKSSSKRRHRVGSPARKPRRRRGRVGSPATDTVMDFGTLAVGFLGAGMLSNVLTLDAKTMSYVKLAAGIGGAMAMNNNKVIKNLALGVALSGVHDIGQSSGMISAGADKPDDRQLFVNLSGAENRAMEISFVSESPEQQHLLGERDLHILGERDLHILGAGENSLPYIGVQHEEYMGDPAEYVH